MIETLVLLMTKLKMYQLRSLRGETQLWQQSFLKLKSKSLQMWNEFGHSLAKPTD